LRNGLRNGLRNRLETWLETWLESTRTNLLLTFETRANVNKKVQILNVTSDFLLTFQFLSLSSLFSLSSIGVVSLLSAYCEAIAPMMLTQTEVSRAVSFLS